MSSVTGNASSYMCMVSVNSARSNWLILLTFCFCTAFIAPAKGSVTINDWSLQSKQLLAQFPSSPATAYENVKTAKENYQGPSLQAEYYLLLAKANANLVMFNRTLAAVEQGLALINQQQQPWLFHQLKILEAESYDQLGQTKLGIDIVKQAIDWAHTNQQYEVLHHALVVRGIQHLTLGQNNMALARFQEATELTEQHTLQTSSNEMIYYTAYVYEYTRQDSLALQQYQQLLDAFEGTNNHVIRVKATYSLGRVTKNVGELDKGAALLISAASYAESIGLMQYSAYANKEMSGYYLLKKQPDNAIRVLQKAGKLFMQSGNPYMLMDVNFTLGRVGLQKKDPQMAQKYLNIAQQYISGESMLPHQLSLNYAKVNLLELQGNYEASLAAMKQLYKDYRKFMRDQNLEKLHELTTLYEVEKTEAQNTLLKQQADLQNLQLKQKSEQYLFAFAAFAFVILALSILYWKSKKHRALLEQLNNTDALTGLASRSFVLQELAREIDLAHRHKHDISVASIDLDFFKQVNDQYGHAAGDEVLKLFGHIAKSHFRHTDILGRTGGEEFLFCFPHTQLAQAEKTLKAFAKALAENAGIISIKHDALTVSVGLCKLRREQTLQDMLLALDKALYEAKSNGRNQICTVQNDNH